LGNYISKQLAATKRAVRMLLYKSVEKDVRARFHKLYYQGRQRGLTWGDTHWLGTQVLKCPLDLWLYQELIVSYKPDLIIETGTYMGGSAKFLATICDIVNHGEVVTVDINPREGRPDHDRVTYLTGSSISPEMTEKVREMAKGKKRVIVILDSAHEKPHVDSEINAYKDLVKVGGYLVVEDTHLNGNPIRSDFGPGPMESVDEFISQTSDFEIDPMGEKFFMTFNPRGMLRRVK